MKFNKNMLLLYAVTDQAWVGKQTLLEQIEEALKGGITYDNIYELKGSSVSGAAVVSAIFGAENIEKSTALLKERVKTVVK